MMSLLSTMLFRLRRSKSFWCLMAFEAVAGLILPILNYRNDTAKITAITKQITVM